MKGIIRNSFSLHCFLLVVLWSLVATGSALGYGGGDGGGGERSGGGSESAFTGYTPEQLRDIYANGFGGTNMDTVDIGEPPPDSSSGDKKATKFTGLYTIPSGLPEFSKKELAQINQAFNEFVSKQAMEESRDAENKEKGATILAIGCSILSGIGAGVGGAVAVTISVVGDGLGAAGGKFMESINKGDSITEAMKKAFGAGAAKSFVSAALSKLNTGSKALDTILGIGGGLGYDEATSGGGPGTPNSAPPPTPTYAPMTTPSNLLGINPVPVHY